MKVIRAETLGFCMGVRRAVDTAYREAASGGRVYTLGPLIHNPHVSAALARKGAAVLDGLELPADLRGAAVIIRAHGVTPELEAEIARRGARIADATCPKVKASQLKAKALAEAGYRIFLAGEKRHSEVIGIQGYAPECLIVGDPQEAETAAEQLAAVARKTALIGQTTISPEEYQRIAAGIQRHIPNLAVIDTVCNAVKDRQESLKSLCGKADAVLIAGGRESANTRRLLRTAEALGKPAWLAESLADIPADIAAYPIIGLSAGASTPDDLIDLIEEALTAMHA